jgi:hypothetical protein
VNQAAQNSTTGLLCLYCKLPAKFMQSSAHIYNGRDYGAVWVCSGTCDAYVGAHPDGSPKGRLADKQLRLIKQRVHALFDPLWLDHGLAYPDVPRCNGHMRKIMRNRAYAWLAERMDIEPEKCHVGMFDTAECLAAIAIINEHKPTSKTIREWFKQEVSA